MTAIENNESRWTVIANGKQIANGTTIRRNGKVSHFVSTDKDKENTKREADATAKEDKLDLQGR